MRRRYDNGPQRENDNLNSRRTAERKKNNPFIINCCNASACHVKQTTALRDPLSRLNWLPYPSTAFMIAKIISTMI